MFGTAVVRLGGKANCGPSVERDLMTSLGHKINKLVRSLATTFLANNSLQSRTTNHSVSYINSMVMVRGISTAKHRRLLMETRCMNAKAAFNVMNWRLFQLSNAPEECSVAGSWLSKH